MTVVMQTRSLSSDPNSDPGPGLGPTPVEPMSRRRTGSALLAQTSTMGDKSHHRQLFWTGWSIAEPNRVVTAGPSTMVKSLCGAVEHKISFGCRELHSINSGV